MAGIGSSILFPTPLQRWVQQELNKLMPNELLTQDQYVEAVYKGLIPLDQYREKLARMGYNAENADLVLKLVQRHLGIGEALDLYLKGYIDRDTLENIAHINKIPKDRVDLILKANERWLGVETTIALYRRGVIDANMLKTFLRANGIPDHLHELVIRATEAFPSAADIVRFAVREVFTPHVAEKFGLYEDMPKEYLEYAKKAGLSEEFAKWYWAAHWELPSITMAFEMFHRKIITREELELLLRAQDVMPYWRDKLIQLSYVLPTRVDVRRMYEIGTITKEQLKEYYEKMGYSPEDAERLTEWTVIEYNREDRTLTVKQILELYEMGEFTREEAKERLRRLGYPEEDAEFKLTLYEHEIAMKQAKEQLALLEQEYLNGLKTYEEVMDTASRLPLSPTTIRLFLTRLVRKRRANTKLPPLETIKRWVKLQIIDLNRYKKYLEQLGYGEEEIRYFLAELGAKDMEETQGGG